MDEIKFSRIVNIIREHPHAYTANGTFMEATIFLEGFALGAKVGGMKNKNSHSKFSPFFQWLTSTKGYEYKVGPWQDFRFSCSSDTEALSKLAQLYREYAKSICDSKVSLSK